MNRDLETVKHIAASTCSCFPGSWAL